MTPTQQPQERVTLVMLYNELKEINKSISAIGTAQAVNSTQIAGLERGLGDVCDDIDDLRKRSDRWDAIVAILSGVAAALAAAFGANK